jgi:hypothetical protein
MKILLYGENWNGTHVNCIAKVLEEKKIRYKIFDFFEILNPRIKIDIVNKVFRKLFYARNEFKINLLLLKEIETFKPSILLISKGVNIYPDTLKIFNDKSIIIANWNPDDFFNKYNSSKNLLNSLELYDFVFSARKHLFQEYKLKGIKCPIYLEWYYIPWLHKKTNNNHKPTEKITFIGTYSKRREEIIKSIEIKNPIEIWGSGWNYSKLSFKKNVHIKNKVLNQIEFPDVISSSLINLNILTKENRDHTNLKLFEITASNGLLLTEHNISSENILGNNSIYYNSDDVSHLNYVIEDIFNPNNLEYYNEIRNKGYLNIINNNSINDRVDSIIDILR